MPTKRKLSPAAKRVLIAKDVITLLRGPNPKLVAETGHIFNFSTSDALENPDEKDAQKFFKGAKQCVVCAKGAILVASILRFDHVKMAKLTDGCDDTYYIYESDYLSKLGSLNGVFRPRMLAEIEWLFEDDEVDDCCGYFTCDEGHRLAHKCAMLPADEKPRLIAIMRLLVENKGEKVWL
jgi:hypothetical protein